MYSAGNLEITTKIPFVSLHVFCSIVEFTLQLTKKKCTEFKKKSKLKTEIKFERELIL